MDILLDTTQYTETNTTRDRVIAHLRRVRSNNTSSVFDNRLFQYLIINPRITLVQAWIATNDDFISEGYNSFGPTPRSAFKVLESLVKIRMILGTFEQTFPET